ncbi:hypothetical protein EMMF5_001801 [Cystobasidiomycetes sp. EMM_F5]
MGTAPQNEKGREKRPCHRFAQNSCSDTEKTGASIKGGHALLSNVVGAIDRGRMVRKREVKRYTARESTLYPSSSEANISEPNAHMNIVRPKYETLATSSEQSETRNAYHLVPRDLWYDMRQEGSAIGARRGNTIAGQDRESQQTNGRGGSSRVDGKTRLEEKR